MKKHTKKTQINTWTSEEDQYLLEATKSGVTYREIGEDLGRTGGACAQRIHTLKKRQKNKKGNTKPVSLPVEVQKVRLDRQNHKWSSEERDSLYNDYAQGATIAELVDKYQRTATALSLKLDDLIKERGNPRIKACSGNTMPTYIFVLLAILGGYIGNLIYNYLA